jgi:putative acetyltransferase
MTLIRPEIHQDIDLIRRVNRLAFAREDEARLVDQLRAGGYSRLSLVAVVDHEVVGYIMFSDLTIVTDRGGTPALALAPLAVTPTCQRRGIGSRLVHNGLSMCRDSGNRIVIVVGHADYYPRFGFSAELAGRLRSVYAGPSFMALDLVAGALEGVAGDVEYPSPFHAF